MALRSKISFSKAARLCGLDLSRARRRLSKRLKRHNSLMRMGNTELMALIQDLRLRPIVKDALADPAIEYRRSLLNEFKALKAEHDNTSKKTAAQVSKSKEQKGPPLALILTPRTRRK